MNISLNQLIPSSFISDNHDQSDVWNKKLMLKNGINYIIESESGKGKSTLVSYCYGIRFDYSGTICIDDLSINDLTIEQWADYRKNKLSIIPQDLQLFPNLTAWENLLIKNKLTEHKKEEEILDMMNLLGMKKHKDKKAGILSLGQQQRVAILRSLLQPFEFLIMDEPFSHIDKNNIEKSIELILKECSNQNSNFILTTLGNNYGLTNMEVFKL